jgi:hypothetical protein
MLLHKALAIALVSVAATLAASAGFAQAAAQDPASVSVALGVLNRVVGHTQRLIAAKNFTRLPHEDGEFKEGVEALESAIAREPADFKRKVEPLIKQAEDRSHALAVASDQGNPATLNAAHDALADSVRTLIAAFPEGERPPVPAPPAAGEK